MLWPFDRRWLLSVPPRWLGGSPQELAYGMLLFFVYAIQFRLSHEGISAYRKYIPIIYDPNQLCLVLSHTRKITITLPPGHPRAARSISNL